MSLNDMQSFEERKAEVRRKAEITAAGWAPQRSEVGSTDWLDELEAELGRLNALRTRSAKEKRGTWEELYTACEAVLEALKRERSRSGADERPAPAKED